jgi:hypothetical protein
MRVQNIPDLNGSWQANRAANLESQVIQMIQVQELPGQILKIFVGPHFNVIASHQNSTSTDHQNATSTDHQNATSTE